GAARVRGGPGRGAVGGPTVPGHLVAAGDAGSGEPAAGRVLRRHVRRTAAPARPGRGARVPGAGRVRGLPGVRGGPHGRGAVLGRLRGPVVGDRDRRPGVHRPRRYRAAAGRGRSGGVVGGRTDGRRPVRRAGRREAGGWGMNAEALLDAGAVLPAGAEVTKDDTVALVKDIEKLARTAKSRVGPANDGFVALGERLARSVPHFLPTFYEEAGRAFLAADSPSYAATMFGRARDAERSYGLAIDEDRTHAVFLEFALAGALS